MNTHLLSQLRNPVLPPALGGNAGANSGGSALGKLISGMVGGLFIAGFFLAFMELLVGGVTWITSGGDKQKLEKSRDQITNAVMGLIIVAASYALMSLVARFFGMDIASLPIPSIAK